MAKKMKSKGVESETKLLKKVSFTLLAPEARNVSLAGDFNGWDNNAHLLKKDSRGKWKIRIDLMPGRYEYRFLVDGEWKNDPNCTSFVPNPFGDENCVIRVLEDRLANVLKLDKIILELIREMQPISSENIWLEITENVDLKPKLSQTEVNQILGKMEREEILERIRLKSEKEKYTVIEK